MLTEQIDCPNCTEKADIINGVIICHFCGYQSDTNNQLSLLDKIKAFCFSDKKTSN